MLDPKQLQIVKKVQSLIETINPANIDPNTTLAYHIDLTKAVFRGRPILGEDDPTPAVTILESPKPIPTDFLDGEQLQHKRLEKLTLLVQGFTKQSHENDSDPAYVFKAQVEQVLSRATQTNPKTGGGVYPDDYLLGKVNGRYLVNSFTIQTGGVRPPTAGVSPTAFFYLPLVITFSFDPTNPYV